MRINPIGTGYLGAVRADPDVIGRLAGQKSALAEAEGIDGRRQKIRTAVQERLAVARSGDLQGSGQALLARYAGR